MATSLASVVRTAHSRNFARVYSHSRRGDPVSEEAELLTAEGALGSLDVEPLLPEDREDLADILQVLLERRAVAEHIVHIHHHRAVQGPASAGDAASPSRRIPCRRRRATRGVAAEALGHGAIHDPHEHRRRAL